MLSEHGATLPETVAEHVAVTGPRPVDRAMIRLNMVGSADGATTVSGVSGGLGNRDDHAVFGALRERADVVLVGLGTVVAEHYHPPTSPHLQIFVIADHADVSGAPDLFASGRATLVLAHDAGPAPDDVRVLRAGTGGEVDLPSVAAQLTGKIALLEGGPTLAGQMVALGLVDEFFLTISPRVVVGDSRRVLQGPEADPRPWNLHHGFVDDEGFLFLRYTRPRRSKPEPPTRPGPAPRR